MRIQFITRTKKPSSDSHHTMISENPRSVNLIAIQELQVEECNSIAGGPQVDNDPQK
jgi:hypothetical protein